jgi:hypothetical protein
MGGEVRSEKEETTLEEIKAWLSAIIVTDGKIATQ